VTAGVGDNNTATATGTGSYAIAAFGDNNTASVEGDNSTATASFGDHNSATVEGDGSNALALGGDNNTATVIGNLSNAAAGGGDNNTAMVIGDNNAYGATAGGGDNNTAVIIGNGSAAVAGPGNNNTAMVTGNGSTALAGLGNGNTATATGDGVNANATEGDNLTDAVAAAPLVGASSLATVDRMPMMNAAVAPISPPVAYNDYYNLPQGGSFTTNTLATRPLYNDQNWYTAPSQGKYGWNYFSMSWNNQPMLGTVQWLGNSAFTYRTSYSGIYGSDLMQYQVTDQYGQRSNIALMDFNIYSRNGAAAPRARNVVYSTVGGQTIGRSTARNVVVDGFGTGARGRMSIPFADTTSVYGGRVQVYTDGTFSYTPPRGYVGLDSFRYVAYDPTTGIANTTLITVNNR
jgi:hypothetical protein